MQQQVLVRLLLYCLCLWLPNVRGQCIDTYEPGCQQNVELGFPQRHCIDPTKYWICHSLGNQAKADLKSCAPNTGFDQDINTCIPWIIWRWQPCVEPPSRPIGWHGCD
ncbi:uncharacterized protein Dwil_GK13539 [Drosophila willistoni]|uniref:Chitin-binding type-2 domain-containing protein n=1 Tax=Drosophila willistoni TaxID=7260 RepID=B4NIB6_DROWI|nr:uncharacterized protein Dwil_GK13539 [Drosophila willistoni]